MTLKNRLSVKMVGEKLKVKYAMMRKISCGLTLPLLAMVRVRISIMVMTMDKSTISTAVKLCANSRRIEA